MELYRSRVLGSCRYAVSLKAGPSTIILTGIFTTIITCCTRNFLILLKRITLWWNIHVRALCFAASPLQEHSRYWRSFCCLRGVGIWVLTRWVYSPHRRGSPGTQWRRWDNVTYLLMPCSWTTLYRGEGWWGREWFGGKKGQRQFVYFCVIY